MSANSGTPRRTLVALGIGLLFLLLAVTEAAGQQADGPAPGSAAALLRLGDLYSQGIGVPVDLARAYEFYGEAAAAGDASARIRVAEMLARGEGVKQDTARGLAMIRAAASGTPALYVTLGDLLISGKAGPAKPKAAIAAYTQAAAAGNIDGDTRLAELFFSGRSVPPDHSKAFGYFQAAMNGGSESAAVRVAAMLMGGDGVPRNVDRGSALLNELAASASARTLIAVGDVLSGKAPGVEPDLARAIQVYRKAAQAGSVEALLDLGDALGALPPAEIDGSAVVEAYETAAAKGSVDASLKLGDLYVEAAIVPPDLAKATGYYARASKAGSVSAQLALASLQAQGGDPSGALGKLRALAASGSDRAYVMIGDLLANGRGEGTKGAVAAYEQAAKLGRTDAMIKLGDLYRYGTLVKKSGKTAVQYYQMAINAGDAYGLYSLGQGYVDNDLGASGTPKRGLALLKQAEQKGIPEATVAIAEAYEAGSGVKTSIPTAIGILEDAAQAGNAAAISHLLGIYRDGISVHNHRVTRPDLAKANATLAKYGNKLDRGGLLSEKLQLEAAGQGWKAGTKIASRLAELSSHERAEFLQSLLTININTLVAVIQVRHRQLGLYKGKVNGLLNNATVSSIGKFCTARATVAACNSGILSRDFPGIEADAFAVGLSRKR